MKLISSTSNNILRKNSLNFLMLSMLSSLLVACGGGGSGDDASSAVNCSFPIASTPQSLTAAETERIIAQAEDAASKRGVSATIAVTDRVGNVLGVYNTSGIVVPTVNIRSGRTLSSFPQGLDGLDNTISASLAAIAKAVTGAYLSSSGNAFSTRTASFIIQEHFPPTVANQASGPLFGVQFSHLPCGDFVTRDDIATRSNGPKRSPLGLSGDPGGFPIYKNGVVVGGIGIMSDGVYGIDLNPTAGTTDNDEIIAQSALAGFQAPDCIRANRITLGGQIPSYSNADNRLVSVSRTVVTNVANYVAVAGYFIAATAQAGKAYGNADSGFAADATGTLGTGAFVVTDGAINRFPPVDSVTPATGSSGLTQAEVMQILQSAIGVANQARAQIRRPLGLAAQVSITVVDTGGNILGMTRTPDAPIFGADVAVQKARTAAFFSSAAAGASITGQPAVTYLGGGPTIILGNYVAASSAFGSTAFTGNPLTNTGSKAFSARAIGNISRPLFPDGINGGPNDNGPLSKSLNLWSPFSTGLQLDLVYNRFTAALDPADTGTSCTAAGITNLNNGIQIFPGSVPIYRGTTLIGAIGISGDGVDQDDMVAFLGLSRASNASGTGYGNAPSVDRADTLAPQGSNLRYVQCPQSPFINSNQQNVCSGI